MFKYKNTIINKLWNKKRILNVTLVKTLLEILLSIIHSCILNLIYWFTKFNIPKWTVQVIWSYAIINLIL